MGAVPQVSEDDKTQVKEVCPLCFNSRHMLAGGVVPCPRCVRKEEEQKNRHGGEKAG